MNPARSGFEARTAFDSQYNNRAACRKPCSTCNAGLPIPPPPAPGCKPAAGPAGRALHGRPGAASRRPETLDIFTPTPGAPRPGRLASAAVRSRRLLAGAGQDRPQLHRPRPGWRRGPSSSFPICPCARWCASAPSPTRCAGPWPGRPHLGNLSGQPGNPGRLSVAGHSAGGHIVGMLLSTRWAVGRLRDGTARSARWLTTDPARHFHQRSV